MSDNEHKNSNSWFKAATICVAFACVAAPTLAADRQPAAPGTAASSQVDAKTEHRKILTYQIGLNAALCAAVGASEDTIKKMRETEEAKLEERATGKPADMARDNSINRRLKKNLEGMVDALRVSRA